MNLVCLLLNILGYFIPKGWKVLLWLRAVHMDPEHHPNPEEFNPERWNVSRINNV